ncbi:MAG: MBL fold metallo-hydrolase [Spirochaetes bacterium]|nr:MBL fold metallo-hydrolase [Spirochaetota bacterium]
MHITFYGVRGSLPTPLDSTSLERKVLGAVNAVMAKKIKTAKSADKFIKNAPFSLTHTYGGNTMCVEVRADDGRRLILDGGSGLRMLGNRILKEGFGKGQGEAHILLSHFHVDHLHGIPFFVPIFIPGNKINFYAGHTHAAESLARYISPPLFPIAFDLLASTRSVTLVRPGEQYEINGFKVSAHPLNHPNDCFAYRIESGGQTVVYATDSEFMDRPPDEHRAYVDFFRNADCLIADAQYSIADSLVTKTGWGHSSFNIDIDLACEANVKRLVFCHYDPLMTDEEIDQLLADANEYLNFAKTGKRLALDVACEERELTL